MTGQADGLRDEIAREQVALHENLQELEHQTKELLDWRAHVRKRPLAALGVAFGGALLVAVVAGSRKPRSAEEKVRTREPRVARDAAPSAAHDTWQELKGAVLGAAGLRLTEWVGELVPELRDHLAQSKHDQAARRGPTPPTAARKDHDGADHDGADGDGATLVNRIRI
jgi:hypothetical protein